MKQRDLALVFKNTGQILADLAEGRDAGIWTEKYRHNVAQASRENPWFTSDQINHAVLGISKMLRDPEFDTWIQAYEPVNKPKNIGVIMAGNIPLAGFHDFLCVMMSGHNMIARLSKDDKVLLPFIIDLMGDKKLDDRIEFSEKMNRADAIIATGSNNTSRYFEAYFGKMPHIFRKNRNSVALITGNENEFDFLLLGKDIFTYYGLGCRNVSKLYVPESYVFDDFFASLVPFSKVMEHSKYMNNFDYYNAVFLMNDHRFLTNNFLIIKEEKLLSSPVSVLHYETYPDMDWLSKELIERKEELQCVVSKSGPVFPAQSQFPSVKDYADQVDTMKFLTGLSE